MIVTAGSEDTAVHAQAALVPSVKLLLPPSAGIEALAGVTRVVAQALGLTDRGTLAQGLRADIAIWDAGHPAELAYRIGFNPLHHSIFGGNA